MILKIISVIEKIIKASISLLDGMVIVSIALVALFAPPLIVARTGNALWWLLYLLLPSVLRALGVDVNDLQNKDKAVTPWQKE